MMISTDGMSSESYSVHGGREDLHDLGCHVPPIDLSTTYPIGDLPAAAHALEELASGAAEADNPVYARLMNPTVRRFERALAGLERAPDAVAFGSGMAALTACLLAARQEGGHIVAVRPLYGGSDHLLTSDLLGLETTFTGASRVAAALREDTALVLLETPANPTLDLADIAAVVAQAGRVPVVVDSTFATPVLQRPYELGASLVLHSATKALGGHGDVMGGVVAAGEEWAGRLRQVRVLTGAVLHPLAGYMLHRGLQTLPVRVERAQQTAGVLARRLAEHPEVERVAYPGLPGADPQGLLGRQMRGPGSLLAFTVRETGRWDAEAGAAQRAARLLAELRWITPAVSLGSADTLIQHPASLTHGLLDPETRRRHGIAPGLLRLSVGLEDVEDLWSDLSGALERSAAPTALSFSRRSA